VIQYSNRCGAYVIQDVGRAEEVDKNNDSPNYNIYFTMTSEPQVQPSGQSISSKKNPKLICGRQRTKQYLKQHAFRTILAANTAIEKY